jgi:hypothetical protein
VGRSLSKLGPFDQQGARHPVEPVGRMLQASSDGEIHALARDVLRLHPDAMKVEVYVRLTINHRRVLEKHAEARRGEAPSMRAREIPGSR